MKKIISIVFLCTAIISISAQTEQTTTVSNPLDLSSQMEQIKLYGVPTMSIVKQMRAKADSLYFANDYVNAITAYEQYAKSANWLANILSQCLEPYYNASYKEKEKIPYNELSQLIPIESTSNYLKSARNIAYLRIGLCYEYLHDVQNAMAYLHKALDLLGITDKDEWNKARQAIFRLIEYNLPE